MLTININQDLTYDVAKLSSLIISCIFFEYKFRKDKFHPCSFLFLFLWFILLLALTCSCGFKFKLSPSVYLLGFMRRHSAPNAQEAATVTASTPRPYQVCVTRATTARLGQTLPRPTWATRAQLALAPPATTAVAALSRRLPAPWGPSVMRPR